MRKHISYLLFFTFFLVTCQQKQRQIVFQGTITNAHSQWIYLSEVSPDGLILLDSCLIKDNLFKIELLERENAKNRRNSPLFYQLSFDKNNLLVTIAQNGDILNIEADGNDLLHSYTITGSKEAQLMWELEHKLALFIDSTEVLQEIYHAQIENDSVRNRVEEIYLILVKNHTQYLTHFIHSNPHSIASIAAFYQKYNRKIFFPEKENLSLLKQIYQNLSTAFPDNENVLFLEKRIELIEFNFNENETTF